MPEVSRDQFDELGRRLQEPDGGFSIRLRTGFEPSSGYMVSQAGTEKKHPDARKITGTDLSAYAGEHGASLARPSRYMGGWHDPDTHAGDLDISHRYTSHDRARAAMWAENQDALYNLNDFHSERNFAKLGTEGTELGRFVKEGPDPDYPEIQRAARGRLKGLRGGGGAGSG